MVRCDTLTYRLIEPLDFAALYHGKGRRREVPGRVAREGERAHGGWQVRGESGRKVPE